MSNDEIASNEVNIENSEHKIPTTTFVEFLQDAPPANSYRIENLVTVVSRQYPGAQHPEVVFKLKEVSIERYCLICNGNRHFSRFDSYNSPEIIRSRTSTGEIYWHYSCRNCFECRVTIAFSAQLDKKVGLSRLGSDESGTVYKFGENPPFGPRTPSQLLSLIGGDREFFLKGRRAEFQGLGIGAFVYYRRVVENKKTLLLSKFAKAARKIGADPSLIEQLETAAKETQFTKAMETVSGAMPESLLIKGKNPFTLLHDVFSGGVHSYSDAECLEMAKAARQILFAMNERLDAVLKEDSELDSAIKLLAKKNEERQRNQSLGSKPSG